MTRPHQSLGDRPPIERFSLARPRIEPIDTETGEIRGRPRWGWASPVPAG